MNVSPFCIMLAIVLLYIVLIIILCFFYLSFQYLYGKNAESYVFGPWVHAIYSLLLICVWWLWNNPAPCFKLWSHSDKNIVLQAKKKYTKNKTKQRWKPTGNNGIPRHKPPNSTTCTWARSRYLSCHAISLSPCFLAAMTLAVTWNHTTNQLLSPINCFDKGNLLQQHK